jgi:hypothetical protein
MLPISEGQTVRDAKLEIPPMGVITGRIFDAEGQPMGHAQALAVKLTYQDGQRVLVSHHHVMTNHRGEYRLFGLYPGRYFVAAKVEERSELHLMPSGLPTELGGSPVVVRRALPDGEILEETYRLVYYGDVLDPVNARPIDLGAGSSTFTGAEIHMSAAKVRSYHIRGVLINGVTGQPAAGIQVRAVPRQQAPHVVIPFDLTDAEGAFDIPGVVPGSYAVLSSAITTPATGQGGTPFDSQQLGVALGRLGNLGALQINANVPVEVGNADIENLRMVATRSWTVSGQVVIEGRAATEVSSDLAKIRLVMTWDPDTVGMPNTGAFRNPAASATVNSQGSFALNSGPGNYRIGITGVPPNTYVKSIRLGSTDVLSDGLRLNGPTESSLDVVIAADSGELLGTAVSGNNPMPNVIVALVPDSLLLRRRFDLYRSAATDASGKFRLQVIPPGEYKLFAWEYAEWGAWHDKQFLDTFETLGQSIRVADGPNPDARVTVIRINKQK